MAVQRGGWEPMGDRLREGGHTGRGEAGLAGHTPHPHGEGGAQCQGQGQGHGHPLAARGGGDIGQDGEVAADAAETRQHLGGERGVVRDTSLGGGTPPPTLPLGRQSCHWCHLNLSTVARPPLTPPTQGLGAQGPILTTHTHPGDPPPPPNLRDPPSTPSTPWDPLGDTPAPLRPPQGHFQHLLGPPGTPQHLLGDPPSNPWDPPSTPESPPALPGRRG